MSGALYMGGMFSVDRVGDDWSVWRFCDDDGGREQLILTTDGMDELRRFFGDFRDSPPYTLEVMPAKTDEYRGDRGEKGVDE